jgi:MinD superfamily P-loop ATPase
MSQRNSVVKMGLGSFFKRNKENKTEEIEDCHIDINADECDGCEKCSIACPNNVLIIIDDVSTVRDPQVCKSCKVCMAICPNDCIEVNYSLLLNVL